jgi:hypothetical protein
MAGTFLAATLAANMGNAQTLTALNDLPDAPAVQQAPSSLPQTPQQQPADTTAARPPQATTPPQPAQPQTSKPVASEDQLHQEEKQRILGVMPTFNMTNNQAALPLTPRQKFQLFFKSTSDPWTFGITAISAGIGQAENSPPEWHGGVEGYAKRWGAGYLDSFDGNLWGNAILTSWWHEDPRYYRKGSGSAKRRFWWAAGSTFWCKRDNGTWGPNYANIAGNFIGGAIANLYYPPSQRGIGPTLEHSASVTGYGILGAEVIEFWPDIAHHYSEKRREKKARQAAERQTEISTH